MDNQKIEEMARTVCCFPNVMAFYETCEKCNKESECKTYKNCKELVEQGYQKVDKDKIMFSKEEIREKYIPKSFYELVEKVHAEKVKELEDLIAYWIENWKQAEKEVAEKYHIKMQKVIHERDYVSGYAKIGLLEENNEIAKQFGVDIKE